MIENLVNPAVPITLDGQDYILRYRAMAFIQYAAECKGDLLHDIRRMGTNLATYGKLTAALSAAESSAAGEPAGERAPAEPAPAADAFATLGPILVTFRDILWAGLIDAQPMIERAEVARMFGLNDFPRLMPLITDAVTRGLPTGGAARPTKPAPKPAGRNSRLTNGGDSGLAAGTQAESGSPNSAG